MENQNPRAPILWEHSLNLFGHDPTSDPGIALLLKLWMSSKAPPMDMDHPPPCPMILTMTYLSMPVLGMTKL